MEHHDLQPRDDFQHLITSHGFADNSLFSQEFDSMSRRMEERSQDFMRQGSGNLDIFAAPPFHQSAPLSALQLNQRRESFRSNANGEPEFLAEVAIDADFTVDEILLERPLDSRTVTIRADRDIVTKSGVSRKNFCHQVSIPDNVDVTQLRLEVARPGMLQLLAPVKPPHYHALMGPSSMSGSTARSHSPRSVSSSSTSNRSNSTSRLLSPDSAAGSHSNTIHVQMRGTPRPSPQSSPRVSVNEKLYHTDVKLGHGFTARDIHVSTEGQRVLVLAVQESGSGMARNEVRHEVLLPLHVDATRLVASVRTEQGLVHLEAPFFPTRAAEEPLVVHHLHQK